MPDRVLRSIADKIVTGGIMWSPPAFFDWLYKRDWYGSLLRDWAFALPRSPDSRVLDLGCGPGGLTHDLACKGWQVTGADRSEAMIRRAGKRAGCAEFVTSDALDLPFGNNTFDVVLSASLVNLVDDRTAFLVEMTRVLRLGGTATVLLPTPEFSAKEAANMGPMNGAAMRRWSCSAPQIDPNTVLEAAASAGLTKLRVGTTAIAGIVTVTGRKA